MSVVIWSSFQSVGHPLYLVAALVFLMVLTPVALRARSTGLAAEIGAVLGFVFGVAVWGTLGYYFNLSAEQKLYHALSLIVDGLWISAVISIVSRRMQDRSAT